MIMRFKLFFLGLALLGTFSSAAQPLLVDGDVCLDIEVLAIHTEGDLEGMTTYRLYATLPGPGDVVTTVLETPTTPRVCKPRRRFFRVRLEANSPVPTTPFFSMPFPHWPGTVG